MSSATISMNPHAAQRASPPAMVASLWRNRRLLSQLVKREVVGRYRGSVFGLAWSFFNPLVMLAIYTFVFSEVFKMRWGGNDSETKAEFAIVLFAGIVVHSFFAEVLARAPGVILGNANYVKKVVFPIEILPVVAVGTSLFHGVVSLAVLLLAFVVFNGYVHWTLVFTPLVWLPFFIFTLGVSWILAALAVFLRDVGQTIGIITMALMFLSPVFYPVTALPPHLRPWLMANPLTFIIEQTREVLVWGHLPNWHGLGIYAVAAIAVCWAGYVLFQKTRRGFADVL
jgi:lipopolysaccharide transport system permease protein